MSSLNWGILKNLTKITLLDVDYIWYAYVYNTDAVNISHGFSIFHL